MLFQSVYLCRMLILQLYRIWLLQIWPELDLTGFRNSNLARAGSGFGENLFSGHRTIHLMKPKASTMLSAAIKRQYSSVLPLLHHSFASFWQNLWNGNGFCIFRPSSANYVVKIANTPLDRPVVFVLYVIKWTYYSCSGSAKSGKSGLKFGRSWTWPDFQKMAGFRICQNQNLVLP